MAVGRIALLLLTGASALAFGLGSAAADSMPRVVLRPSVVHLFKPTSIAVTGVSAHSVEARFSGATDAAGLAYEWTPYRWHRLRKSSGAWRGALPAPALPGIYELQLRLDGAHAVLQSQKWLLRVFLRGTLDFRSFATPLAVVRDFVGRLPGHEVLVAVRRFPPAAFDHRDARLHRIFVVAYAPRGHTRLRSRLGMFVTAVRDGFNGRWRLLDATVSPYG
ncbi:MAG TPA: hypothetical protein VLW49_05275 [Gaiellaceae bacterium]|nr:hypothetical protein [Gaiellaceae bacterium]